MTNSNYSILRLSKTSISLLLLSVQCPLSVSACTIGSTVYAKKPNTPPGQWDLAVITGQRTYDSELSLGTNPSGADGQYKIQWQNSEDHNLCLDVGPSTTGYAAGGSSTGLGSKWEDMNCFKSVKELREVCVSGNSGDNGVTVTQGGSLIRSLSRKLQMGNFSASDCRTCYEIENGLQSQSVRNSQNINNPAVSDGSDLFEDHFIIIIVIIVGLILFGIGSIAIYVRNSVTQIADEITNREERLKEKEMMEGPKQKRFSILNLTSGGGRLSVPGVSMLNLSNSMNKDLNQTNLSGTNMAQWGDTMLPCQGVTYSNQIVDSGNDIDNGQRIIVDMSNIQNKNSNNSNLNSKSLSNTPRIIQNQSTSATPRILNQSTTATPRVGNTPRQTQTVTNWTPRVPAARESKTQTATPTISRANSNQNLQNLPKFGGSNTVIERTPPGSARGRIPGRGGTSRGLE